MLMLTITLALALTLTLTLTSNPNPNQAVPHLEAAVRGNPNLWPAHANLATIHGDQLVRVVAS